MSKNITAIYPGTFDPITLGHIDIIHRAANIFEKVVVTLAVNTSKKPLFNVEERLEMIHDAIDKFENVSVAHFDGLLVDFAREQKSLVIIRGLRAISDFEYEFQMALMNKKLAREISTVFLMPNEKYTYLNSTIVKSVAKFHGNIDNFVTKFVADQLHNKFNGERP
ncbi:MAG TPA: pantetheine-phosphate adenylyltransferase [Caldithrix abyssi]|uniref:Phosphopantetheine adenylyltransferase n=1 Tax=Caldithrix abyssi TaxID=187145 RepID=A0A7V1LPC9_CALAY|nr:pantetheine-phosphate adenylyltransferase [Caldithrix abyssi]